MLNDCGQRTGQLSYLTELRNATAPNKMQAQQCGDVLANLFAFHIFASACGEESGFKITPLRLHSRCVQLKNFEMRFTITLILYMFISDNLFSQVKYNQESFSNFVVCLVDQTPKETRIIGTSTVISNGSKYFLLTAAHVTNAIEGTCILIFRAENDKPFIVPLESFTKKKINTWTNHKEADISYIEIMPYDNDSGSRLKQWSFPVDKIYDSRQAIPREMTITCMGFPVVDEIGQHFSPLTFNSFFSSGLVTMKRADNKTQAIFQLLQNPSIQGYSGGPVLMGLENAGISVDWNETLLVGIMHGTYSDNTGGKLAMVTPSFYIREILK